MKRVVMVVLAITGFLSGRAQTPDSIANKLIAIDETAFIGKPLDSLIKAMPPDPISMKVYGFRNTARFLAIKYPNRIWVELHVREFHFMEPYDPNWIWNVNLMRKEKLYSIRIFYDTGCYKGCPQY